MFSIALYRPEIPPNTGNIIRLCANTGCNLHLVGTLGFSMEEKQLRRAGLDYRQYSRPARWPSFKKFKEGQAGRLVSFSTKDENSYAEFSFEPGDILLFGPESRGLPPSIRNQVAPRNRLTVPMRHPSRSLNLSNCVAIVVYEAWRQNGFRSSPSPN